MTGPAQLSTANGIPAFAPVPGYDLAPGDKLDTHGGGRVVIELTDGSMIVVQPDSLIVIKDFRAAASIRELFDIMLGSVRVKINHFGGRPNPYRINSPTASIAVRGTEFSVTVNGRGDTQVLVYEGIVEVTNLADPTQSVVIEAGRGALLVPGQAFELFNVPAGREIAERRGSNEGAAENRNNTMNSRDIDTPRNIASVYEQYIAGLSEIGQVPFLLRYTAFPEAHLDSLENPAYATGFNAAEGRVVFLPSLTAAGLQLCFELVKQLEGMFALAVELVHEYDDRRLAHAADFHKPEGLLLHALDAVDDEDDAVHRGERAVGVLGKVLMAGRVEQIDLEPVVVEAHDRRCHRDAALALDVHKVRGRALPDLVRFDRTGHLDRPAEKQKLLRQRGLSRVRVADDGEGPPLVYFV